MFVTKRFTKKTFKRIVGVATVGLAPPIAAVYYTGQDPWQLTQTSKRFGYSISYLAMVLYHYRRRLNSAPDEGPEREKTLHECHEYGAKKMLEVIRINSGLYIKLGQLIGQLAHIVPDPYIDQMTQLFDKAPKRDYSTVKQTFREELGKAPEELFDDWNPVPISSASLAQVYVARSKKDGKKIAVKVQHKDLLESVDADLSTVKILVKIVHWLYPKVDYRWFVEEGRKNITMELDFQTEAMNQELCASIFEGSNVSVPRTYPEYSTRKILTMEFAEGFPLYDPKTLSNNDIEPKALSNLIAESFYKMIFLKGFVHADPHPANMLIRKDDEGNLRLTILDHGLYRPLTDKFRLNYCKLWMAFLSGNVDDIRDRCKDLGIEDQWRMIVSMITLRPWRKSATSENVVEMAKEIPSKEEIQAIFTKYFLEISKSFETMPRELLLIFKTRDQLMSLDKRLGLEKQEQQQDRQISLICLKALEADAVDRATGLWKKMKVASRYRCKRWVIKLKFWLFTWYQRLF